ncbi:hypothetical protein GLOTRDRAFT_133054 [Gloeophyllum trabeum ATCC 11539]|uniref:Uncharacterized protein n=1 Tax=Gloeophyllum trabeum (strain ATCC 11539 / FP-39264 / Madison 617) TaxID=670483 RepID=S7PVN1_GLOTA|nr:uncharacterized protein GLOTRDRAFT_133054 [Gloeophyllum trabeum ATCC 11539]EPQ51686.1 hypothetical protein GLOTRDRAFT_133054 [Gloeophyllum trabeum ATCC 11539]
MSGLKHFAITGAGNVWLFIASELLSLKVSRKVDAVLILTPSAKWTDWIFTSHFRWDILDEKIIIWWGTKLDHRRDVARFKFTTGTLTTLFLEQLKWAILYFEAERKSMKEIAESYFSRTSKAIQITHTPLALAWDKGEGVPASDDSEGSGR